MKVRFLLIGILVLFAISFADSNFRFHLPPYTHHTFDNGFEVILVENHTNPLIASVVVVRTGLCNETPETNGISHMLEHMTFNGTEKRTQKQLYDELDYYGIYLNAQTSEDYTTFMALNHKDKIEQTLDIMSDMLFHSTFPAKKFDKEKGIIAEEIRKDSENPDFQKEQALRRAFYKNPPYSMPVIGTEETVRNMKREQVMNYYHTYYAPNNMIAIVIGDFDSNEMLTKLKKYFGTPKAHPIPENHYQLTQSFPFVYEEEEGEQKTLYLKLPAPTFYSDSYIPFTLFYHYALADPNSFILKEMSQQLNLKRVQSSYEVHPEFGVLTISATANSSIGKQDFLKAFQTALQTLQAQLPTARELQVIRRERAIHEILQSEKILYYGFLKAQDLTVGGFDAFARKMPALFEAPISQVHQVIQNYPKTFARPASLFTPGHWTETIDITPYLAEKQTQRKGKSTIYRKVLPNGLTVLLLQNSDNPVLAMHFLFKNRAAWEPPGKEGIADFLHHALFKASAHYPAEQLDQALREIGAEVKAYDWNFVPYDDYYNVPHYSYVRFVTLDQFFDTAMDIVADNILHPELESVFKEVQGTMKFLAAREQKNARVMGKYHYYQMVMGKNHPLAQPVSGSPASIARITPEDLRQFHREYFSANNTILSIVSSLDSARVFAAVEKYFGDMPVSQKKVEIPPIPTTTGTGRDSMKIGTRQAYIYLGYAFEGRPDHAPTLLVLNQMLSSQIAFSLREQKGWAYRLGTSISRWKNHYLLTATMGTGRGNTQRAIQGLLDEIEQFRKNPITEEAVTRTRNSILAALTRRRASRESQAFTLGINEFSGRQPDYFFRIYQDINQVSVTQLIEARDRYIRTSNYKLFYTIPTAATNTPGGMPMGMPGRMPH